MTDPAKTTADELAAAVGREPPPPRHTREVENERLLALQRDVGPPGPDRRALQAIQEWEAQCPRMFREARLDDLDGELRATMAAFAAEVVADTAGNLILVGDVGAGKTHAALAGAREVVRAGGSLRFRPLQMLLAELRASFGSMPADLLRCDLLILELDQTPKANDWQSMELFDLLNQRCALGGRPVLVTSNLDLRAPRDRAGRLLPGAVGLDTLLPAAAFDRLTADAEVFEVRGPSRRQPRRRLRSVQAQ